MRLYARTRIVDRSNPPFNLVISNVPGPRTPLYAAGARLEHFYPVLALVDGQGLNMTVQSYCDNLDFGFLACRELVPDVWDMVGYLHDALDELKEAAGVESNATSTPTAAKPAKAKPAKAAKAKPAKAATAGTSARKKAAKAATAGTSARKKAAVRRAG